MEVLLRPSLLLLVVYKGDERLSYKGLRHGPFYLRDRLHKLRLVPEAA